MKKIFPYLTYAGAIPFIFCCICLVAEVQQLPILGSVERVLVVYALVISTFLTGAHWGQHLQMKGSWNRILPIFSNVIAVLLWLGFLILSIKVQIAMFISAFIILLMIDNRLYHSDHISHHYFRTRCFVTTIVIVSLIISGSML